MKTWQLAVWLLLGSALHAQIPQSLNVIPFTDFNYGNVEPPYDYDFDDPVYADVLLANPNNYTPEYSNRYFMSIYGPRHKEVSTSNIKYFDFHKGQDITADVSFGGNSYSENNPPDIHCMCDGEVYEIFTGPNPESTGTGIYVTVECDSTFKANQSWGNIYMAYRHLASVANGLQEGDPISKGDVVGQMGATGHTSTVHLHYSVIRRNEGFDINVNPMRVFDPNSIPHLTDHLTTAEITQLEYSSTEALFRIAIPYNMANIRAIEVSLPNGVYEKTYDFEEVSQLPEDVRDDNNAVDGLELFAYPFNRGHDCYRRVWDHYDDGEITTDYPACPDLGPGNFYPFLNEGLHQTPAYVLDFKATDLPPNFDITDLNIKVIDIWGYGVEANGVEQAANEHFAWAMITDEDDDAEEYENGEVDLSSSDLELVYDGNSKGNQTVGLLFRELGLPKDATIMDAFLQFRADASHADPVDLKIKAEDAGNAADFAEVDDNISNRDTTSASTYWQPAAWTIDDMGDEQKCTGLTEVVQEVVTRNDWTSNSPLAFIITGTGRREAEGYSSSSLWKNTYVYVAYSDEQAPPPNEAPEITLTAPLDGTIYSEPETITISATASDPDGNLANVEFFVDGFSVGAVGGAPYELDWDIPDYGSFTIHAVATDLDGLSTVSLAATINVFASVIDIQISNGNDDVEELENGTIWKTNQDLELCYDDYISGSQGLVGHQHVGLRFQQVNVPQGALISNAYIQFTADETDDDATLIIIRGEDVDDASEFGYSANNVSSRNMTADSVTWFPPAWNQIGASGADERTPDISAIIQTIVDRNGWSAGNSMVLMLYGYDELKRVAESYDGMASGAAKLHIEFASINPQSLETSVTEFHDTKMSLNVFPNPVSTGTLTVELLQNQSTVLVEVIDMVGRTVDSKSIDGLTNAKLEFQTELWPSGMYFVRARSENEGVLTTQFLVQ